MKPLGSLALLAFLSLGLPMKASSEESSSTFAHVRNSFHLVVHASYKETAPLFGPNGERGWSEGDWDPHFFHPQPGRDIQGAVFAVEHGVRKSIWVNTVFDIEARHFQYVYFIPDALVSTIDVNFTAIDSANTRVDVVYTRTALDAAANDHVRALGERDAQNGPAWEKSVNDYLAGKHKH